jgi:nucleoside-diphosphate-sugar epimerase
MLSITNLKEKSIEMNKKRVLLIAGGGTLGSYTAKELLRLGHRVDVICLEDKTTDDPNLRFFKMEATVAALTEFLSKEHYDGVVNFLHYTTAEDYEPYHKLLSENTEHLIFLSSYRVYADEQHPITETAPMLLDVSKDEEFVKNEKYAISKAICEKFLKTAAYPKNWTVVRPVISFSALRFDLLMHSGDYVIKCAENKQPVYMPQNAKELIAGIDWAGNSGKLIANLLFKPEAIGEAYTISSSPDITWGELADIYHELTGAEFRWVEEESFLNIYPWLREDKGSFWRYVYDRCFDRAIDNTKVLKATGLCKNDFSTVKEGLQREIDIYYLGRNTK